jgi:hypothetical protein
MNELLMRPSHVIFPTNNTAHLVLGQYHKYCSILYVSRKYPLSDIVPDSLPMLAMYSMCFASLIGAVLNSRMVITAIHQILLHEHCDRIYRKT